MSNLLKPLDPEALNAVTGGTSTKTSSTKAAIGGSSSDALLQQLTSLSSTIKEIGNTASKTGFSTTEVLMLGLLLNQRSQVNVFVRRPYW